jgi:cytochrome oxidase Cu insertion factor (SCO1/SenC/PrrC family)
MRGAFAAAVASALVVGIAVGVVLHRSFTAGRASARPTLPELHGQATWRPGRRPAPAFALRDQHGRRVSLASFRGRPVALLFLDSLCRGACPLEGRGISFAVAMVAPAARPRVVVVSVDPAGDTRTSVAEAARHWRLPHDFEWLFGTRPQLRRVWRAYDITVLARTNDVVHSTAFYLIDRKGDERAGFVAPFEPAFVADDLRALAAEVM